MNEQLFLSPLSFPFRPFNDSMCLFAFFFFLKDFLCFGWILMLFQIDMVLDGI